MQSQPEPGIVIQLLRAPVWIVAQLCLEKTSVAFAFRRRRAGIDDRLHNPARAEDCRRPECQDVRSRATFSLISFRNGAATYFEFLDVMVEDALRDRDHPRDIRNPGARARLDVAKMRSGISFWSQPEKENIDAAQRFKLLNVPGEFAFQIVGVRLHRREALNFLKEGLAQQPLKIPHKTQTVFHAHGSQRVLGKHMKPAQQIVERWSPG